MRERMGLSPREEAYRLSDSIRSLAATYWWFDVDEDVKKLSFDFSGLSNSRTLAVDSLLLLPEDGVRWVHRPLSSGKTEFCRTNPAQEVHAAILVLSNHDYEGIDIEGEIAIEASAEPCSGLQLTYEYVGTGGYVPGVRFTWTVDLEPQEDGGWAGQAEPVGTFWKNTDGIGLSPDDYCVVKGVEGKIDVWVEDVDGDLYVLTLDSPDSPVTLSDGSPVNLPGPFGAIIPVGETSVSSGRVARSPDDVDLGACSAFSNETETVTIRRP